MTSKQKIEYVKQGGEISILISHNEMTFSFFVNDHYILQDFLRDNTFYELPLLRCIEKHCTPGVFIDAGACFGNHSVYLAAFRKDLQVVAFEPNPKTYNLLLQNIRVNNAITVRPERIALSNENSRTLFHIPDTTSGGLSIGGSSLIKMNEAHFYGSIQVRTYSLDFYLATKGIAQESVTGMKIDVEGAESLVLEGAVNTIQKAKPELFIEIWGEQNLNEISDWLSPFGYELKERYGVAPVYHFSVNEHIPAMYTKPYIIP